MSKTIVRARRRHRFVILDQRAVEDTRLSWAARGLLAYLLSRPDDWKIYIGDLRKRGDLGRDGIYKLLKELRTASYVRFERARDAGGRIRGGTYFVQEIPESLHPALPDTGEPDAAEPYPVKPDALTTTDLDIKRTTTTTPTTTNHSRDFHETRVNCIEFAPWVPEKLKSSALHMVKGLDPSLAQLVIDEWAALLSINTIRLSPLGYLHTLVKRLQSGEFIPKYADRVAAIWRDEIMERE